MKLSARSRRRRRTWRRSTAPPSQPSWAQRCGTRLCPTMETPSSWSTWTWRSSCRRTASPPASPHHLHHHHDQHKPQATSRHQPITPPAPPTLTPSVMDLSSHASINTSVTPPNCLHSSPARAGLPSSRNTPSPIDPDSIQIPIGYEPDPADLALSSVPGQEMFDPRKRKFSAEELKPQPMIKKARKVFMPEDLKQDDKYWASRRKNNFAAKRSRDARRLKENQIAIRAGFLEKENSALRWEVADLRKELGRTKNILSKYKGLHGPL
ncbi:HLF transcription factor, PAR bZIP family member b isoform X3 [Hippoglossus hippoglossus]|uniref:HLF transcription factor, PAR bZIP family member b isoform X3 n=1 Tax=Hippoglossus hippoglossus TaxID=8267 RepID=UPI00148C8339|nr:HLF transcription factor, PAR bZIP family member b isoform X3 [Hippoglossus hippoglossus]